MLGLEDVLRQYLLFIDRESSAYRQIEDFLVQKFASSLETAAIQEIINPDQLSIDLEADDIGDETH